MKSKFFEAQKIMDNVTMISGLAGELCYLVEGRETALLVDGLSGIGSLKAFVRELTDKPVELVLTHSHPDHMGAAFEYGRCYIHPDDISGLYEAGDAERRYSFAAAGAKDFTLRMEDAVPCTPVCTLPVADGHIFDLGGTQLEVIAVPGHTWGHIVLLDRAARVVYSGDAVNCNTLMFLGGASIEEYRESLLHLQSYEYAFDVLWGGHGGVSVPKRIVPEAIGLCEEIMAGTDQKAPGDFMGRTALYAREKDENFRRYDGGIANIAYSTDRIWKKQVVKP
jgi:glyoxylase-like metal-dependent hydrolase (beta-lactamase superfamily II)